MKVKSNEGLDFDSWQLDYFSKSENTLKRDNKMFALLDRVSSVEGVIPSQKDPETRSPKVYTLGSRFRIAKENSNPIYSEMRWPKEIYMWSHLNIIHLIKINSIDFTSLHYERIST